MVKSSLRTWADVGMVLAIGILAHLSRRLIGELIV